ncbi:MAG TPA: excisionase family DNA-binding protein [Gemmataceae bacterium]|nr:excisionase family DNA-binding protein [Gemmataceae bacterium]
MSTQTATTESRYLSYSAAAKYISVSIGTLRRMAERGEVRAYPVGERLIRFDRAELDRLVLHGTNQSFEQG